jgi:8-oxo-dGTP pyrophosphatase MutT (NUDIX family)
MWLFTNIGFFSAVQKPGTDFLTVRARVKQDLDNLREKYLPHLSATQAKGGTDYPWRATVSHADFAAALGKIAMDIDYSNYKNEVTARQGKARASRYGKVWQALYDMPEDAPTKQPDTLPWSRTIAAGKKVAYGGVVLDPAGNVLLREPKNHFDGYVWTFAKGRPDPGETPEQTALREVYEETGVHATIISPLPGEFAGGTTINRYFLMTAQAGSGGIAPDDKETASVRWANPDEAVQLLALTTNPTGRKRDAAVLAAALAFRAG